MLAIISSVGLGEAGLPVGQRGQALRGARLACGCTVHAGCFSPAGYTAPYLTVFSENSVDVFDVRRAEWVQTVPLKKVKVSPQHGWHGGAYRGLTTLCFLPQVRPLNPEGSLFLYGTEKVRLTYLRNPLAGEEVCACLHLGAFTCAQV